MPTIRDYIDEDFNPPINDRYGQGVTLSEKPWASNFKPIHYTIRQNDIRAINEVFGDEWDDDGCRLDTELPYAFPERRELISSEGDVTRVFHREISGPVLTAWEKFPPLVERNQIGPLYSSTFSGTVDSAFTYSHVCATIGEMKAPGIITQDWMEPDAVSSTKKRLGKELRGYAYHYRCPQVFCYDGVRLLVLRFRARNFEDIKRCEADCWLVPTVSDDASMRYVFYRLLSEGFHRIISQKPTPPELRIGSCSRSFEWATGKPYWKHDDDDSFRYEVPFTDYERVFHPKERAWAWNSNTGTHVGWDTTGFSVNLYD